MGKTTNGILVSALVAIGSMTLQGCATGGLSEAAYNGNLARARILVSQGAEVNRYDRWGWTPLIWAVYYRHDAVARLLLENGANVNLPTVREYGTVRKGSTPLIVAAYYGYAGTVRLLLEHGADPGKINEYGFSAYHYAEQYGHDETMRLLKPGGPEQDETAAPENPATPDIEITPQ